MLASRRDRLLWPGSVCRATPAYDARGTFENVCCSCTPSGNNHQLAGASRHLHEKCPKGEALGAVCCWSQDRPTPETGGRPHLCASNIGRSSTIGGRPQGAFTPALSPDVREQLDPPSLAQPHIGQCLGGARFATCEFKVQFLDGTPESMVVGTWCPVSILLELATRGSRGSHRRACAAFRHTRMAQ